MARRIDRRHGSCFIQEKRLNVEYLVSCWKTRNTKNLRVVLWSSLFDSGVGLGVRKTFVIAQRKASQLSLLTWSISCVLAIRQSDACDAYVAIHERIFMFKVSVLYPLSISISNFMLKFNDRAPS